MPSQTNEQALEALIEKALTGSSRHQETEFFWKNSVSNERQKVLIVVCPKADALCYNYNPRG